MLLAYGLFATIFTRGTDPGDERWRNARDEYFLTFAEYRPIPLCEKAMRTIDNNGIARLTMIWIR